MFKRSGVWLSLLLLVLLATGCSPESYTKPIDPNGGIWDRYFVFPLSWALDTMAGWMAGSYGLSILVVTLIIRLVILPLTYKQMKSSKQLQELQPELLKLQKKYKNNQEKLQLETMKLFQKHNVNPLMGCLPILIQMPILIAFYHAIMRNSEIREHTFLWMDLGAPDPFYVLPVLAAVATYFQTMISRKMMPTAATMSPQMEQQQQMLKTMSFILPAMILFIAVTLPSALSLYWVYTNLFSILQMYFLYTLLYGEKDQKEAAS